jgi:two-component system chemotaxis response regulator CheB
MLAGEKEIAIVGEAVHGRDAVLLAQKLHPDVILMDLRMPVMDGKEATREIMSFLATPIIVFSSMTRADEAQASIEMLAAGALDVIAKPDFSDRGATKDFFATLVRKIRIASGVAVVRRIDGQRRKGGEADGTAVLGEGTRFKALGIGSSTGGPAALRDLLARLPPSFPLPVLAVQHITAGFTEGFAEWLRRYTPLEVRLAKGSDMALPGTVLLAPEGRQMEVLTGGAVRAVSDRPEGVHLPSVDVLFSSIASVYGRRAIGVILTGMGCDGVEGLGRIRSAGGVTIAQDEESSAVFGMPGEAIRRGAAEVVLPPGAIADFLVGIVNRPPVAKGA